MKNSIIVKVSDLRSMIQDIRRSGCDIVSLTINDTDNFDGDIIPPSISLSACRNSSDVWIDFEEIEAIPNESELEKESLTAVHMSSNLL